MKVDNSDFFILLYPIGYEVDVCVFHYTQSGTKMQIILILYLIGYILILRSLCVFSDDVFEARNRALWIGKPDALTETF